MASEIYADFRKDFLAEPYPNKIKAIPKNKPDASVFIWENPRKVHKLTMLAPHAHEYYEVIFFVAGNVKYYVEGAVFPVGPGDILLLKKGEMHTLLVEEDTPYDRILLQFDADALIGDNTDTLLHFLDDRPYGKCNLYKAADLQQAHWFWLARQICDLQNPSDKRVYLASLLWQLYGAQAERQEVASSDVIVNVIRYINEHITEELSIAVICEKFFVSKSQLCRKFKENTDLTIWEYILAKRLHLARTLLSRGNPPAAACQKSGFRDYSSFYRLYKQRFGASPREAYPTAKR